MFRVHLGPSCQVRPQRSACATPIKSRPRPRGSDVMGSRFVIFFLLEKILMFLCIHPSPNRPGARLSMLTSDSVPLDPLPYVAL